MSVSIEAGMLYVVATPLGNLGDISPRAAQVLCAVDVVAAEDTRVSGRLLQHLGASARELLSLHEHNEQARVPALLRRLLDGQSVALVSDAGTPLISDPGFRLVAAARKAGVRVSPVPGPCALVAALSVAGLPTDHFVFEGFLPARRAARRARLEALAEERRTLVMYESSHRVQACLADLAETFGAERRAVVARELTKRFEQVRDGSLGELVQWLAAAEDRRRGEFVLVIEGDPSPPATAHTVSAEELLRVLAEELPTRQAADIAARVTGGSRQGLYREAQRLRNMHAGEEDV